MNTIEKLLVILILVIVIVFGFGIAAIRLGAPAAAEDNARKPEVIRFSSPSGQVECAVLVYDGDVRGFECVPIIPQAKKLQMELP